jgi:hypothetical protein
MSRGARQEEAAKARQRQLYRFAISWFGIANREITKSQNR